MLKDKFSFLIFSFLLFVSCSRVNVDYHMPSTPLLTPETTGKFFKLYGEMDIHSATKVSVGRSFESLLFGGGASIDTSKERKTSYAPGLNAGLGIFKRLDLYIKYPHDAPKLVGLKFQFIGAPARESKKGFKMAMAFAYGKNSDHESNERITSTQSGSNFEDVDANLDTDQREYILLMGYRGNADTLYYSQFFYSKYRARAVLTTGSGQTFDLSTTSEISGISLGCQLGEYQSSLSPYVKGEIGYSRSHVQFIDKHDHLSLGLVIGVYF